MEAAYGIVIRSGMRSSRDWSWLKDLLCSTPRESKKRLFLPQQLTTLPALHTAFREQTVDWIGYPDCVALRTGL